MYCCLVVKGATRFSASFSSFMVQKVPELSGGMGGGAPKKPCAGEKRILCAYSVTYSCLFGLRYVSLNVMVTMSSFLDFCLVMW